MEVTKDNFDDLLPEILDGIEKCTFIAVDTELTGLRPTDEKENYFDTVEERYKFLQKSASQFLLIQYGMVLFTYDDSKDEFTHRAYNFYLFPKQFSSSAPNVRFLCEAASLEFLASWGFDFNKLIYKGIPYLSLGVEQKMKENYDKKQLYLAEENSTPLPVPENQKKFMEETQKQIRSLVSGDLKELFLEDMNPFQRKLVFNNIKPKYKDLYFETVVRDREADSDVMDSSSVSESDNESMSVSSSPNTSTGGGAVAGANANSKSPPSANNNVPKSGGNSTRPQTPQQNKSSRSAYLRALRVVKMTEKEKKVRDDEKKREAIEIIDKSVGFSKVIQKISETGKIVVGHNMVLDVAHSVHRFVSELPEDLASFKTLVQTAFPNLVDTKLMCCTHPFREHFTSTVLADVLERVQEDPFGLPQINKEQNETTLSYNLGDGKSHEAGYDAFITGVCFIGLCQYLGKLQNPKKARVLPNSPLVMPFLNKLYLMRMLDISYLNISGTDLTPTRDHVFHVFCPKEATTKSILSIFQPFGQVQVWWQDDNNLFVCLQDKDQASLVMRNIEYEKPAYRVLPFTQYQSSMKRPLQRDSPERNRTKSMCDSTSTSQKQKPSGSSANNKKNPNSNLKGPRQHSSSSTSSSGSEAGNVSPPLSSSEGVHHQKKKRPKTEKSSAGAKGKRGLAKANEKESKGSTSALHFEEPSTWD